MGVIGAISDLLQTREDGLRLLIAVLLGYPAAAVYRTFLYDKAPRIQHLYFVVVGIFLHFFFCGAAVWHTLLSIVLAYGITNFIPGTTASVVAAHVAFLGHLLVGYWFSESDKYDITWTTPFCIISLKHIGLVMDVYDGRHFEKLKPDQKLTAIKDSPDLLEVAGFTLFFSGTLVGGQLTLARFRAFVNGEYLDPLKKEVRATSLMPSLGRFVAACFYMVIHQWGAVWIPSEYLNSPEFFALSFWWKLIWITLFFRFTMYRYCSAWLYAEGAAILSGVAYNGQKDGKDQWDGVRDMHITGWELGRDFNSVIASFNVGTNTFAKNHIFRRLRWLNSKLGAQFATLMYLAVWHGYHLGYFLLFIYEMITMLAQEQLYSLINRTPGGNEFFAQAWVRPITWVFGRVVINVSMAFAFLTFGLVKKEIWIGPVKSLYFCGYVFYIIIWPITYQILLRALPRKPKETKDAKDVVPNEQVKETKKEL